ncbi:hypothetical protein L6452_18078 [Arctium lappa]|uniref:Uncharacterized protein n=1 Tax=Arctium lappa TaxID=4217 RepID=A0ACB9C5C4_ARCLA|nr:hypothetical protein L6452_18078 [Arctium lappa]
MVRSILRWRSFRDLTGLEENKVHRPSDFTVESPSRCNNTTTTATTTTSARTPRSSWCDSDFTVSDSLLSSEKEEANDSGLYSGWSELTHECLFDILTRLTFEDRWRGPMLVCKSWLQASKDYSLHSVLDLESSFESLPSQSVR